ncbi:MAG: septum formation initiator family protein [Clostridia bacterium]|nr:septum formation initiator family protein [Clostridia bacterium]
MNGILKNRKHSVLLLFFVLVVFVFTVVVFANSHSHVTQKQEELAALQAEYNAISEENAEYEYILNEADVVEQYEYRARELGYGYADEVKVIDVTPGN